MAKPKAEAGFAGAQCSVSRPRRIVITAEVRTLLAELDKWMDQYLDQSAKLAPGVDISHAEAVDIGADCERVKGIILGIAWRLNKASTGRK